MQISTKDWLNYIKMLSKLNDEAGKLMQQYVAKHGFADTEAIVDYAYGLITTYGEGSAALAAEMYDATAALSGVTVPAAEVAETAKYGDVAKAIYGTIKHSKNPNSVGNTVSRYVKMAGADTTLKNAERDGAQFAWVPMGDTCSFCITLASRGWQYMSKKAMKNGHAEHIHANCDCTYSVRFDSKSGVRGYNPDKYKAMYDNAEGNTPEEKINSMRRMQYQDPAVRAKINAQKREAYALQSAVAEESHRGINRSTEIARSIIESPDYGRRLSSVDTNSAVTKNIIEESRKILNHRNGTAYEDLMFIDINSGKYKVRTDFDVERKVAPSKQMKDMVKKADDYTIAVLHNHSGSTVPSPADIKTLVDRKHAYGVILCHDGSIYKYSCINYNAPIYMSAVEKLDKMGYNKSNIEAFIRSAKEAGVTVEVL